MIIVIKSMQPAELSEALDVLGKAFATMSSSTTIYKGRSRSDIERRMQIVFGALLKHMPGQIFVAKQNGRVVGAMRMVEWPGCQMKPLQGLKVLPALMRAGGLGEMRRAMKMRGTWAKKDPKKPHWHIDPIGVTPELQGQGIGSKLMEYYCKHIDELGMAAYHETDSRKENVRFYERFGFKVVGEETIMDFPVWYLWRPARSKAT
ncbi:MAG: GNAT family N-acetyltransferase [Planctomycetota bacterium]|jgi:ribosomal protein S18 acetylase RimI-like enzyme